jgi:hypothetical protein
VRKLALLLPFVVVSFAANSLITRFVVARGLLDAGLLGTTRFAAGAVVLAAVALARGERSLVRRAHLVPALWLGVYALCISYGYLFIGAAPGPAWLWRRGGWSARRWRSRGWPCWRRRRAAS